MGQTCSSKLNRVSKSSKETEAEAIENENLNDNLENNSFINAKDNSADVLNRLNIFEVEALLKSFRIKCKMERTVFQQINDLNIWKRLSIMSATLNETIDVFHPSSIRKRLIALNSEHSQHNTTSLGNGIEIIPESNLFRAFKCMDYISDRRDFSLVRPSHLQDGNKVISFSEYCAVVSLCLHGTEEEMLTLIFLLFAESISLDDKSGLDTEVERSSSNELHGNAAENKDGSSKPLQTSFSSKKKPFTIAKISNQNGGSNLLSLTGRGRFVGSNNAGNLVITELGMCKLLLLYVLYGDISQLFEESAEVSSEEWNDFKAVATHDIASFLSSIISQINRLSNESYSPPIAFTYNSFMMLFTDNTSFLKSLQESKSLFSSLSSKTIGNSSGDISTRERKDSRGDSHSQHQSIEQLLNAVRKIHFERGRRNGIERLLLKLAEGAVHNYLNTLRSFHEFFDLEKKMTEVREGPNSMNASADSEVIDTDVIGDVSKSNEKSLYGFLSLMDFKQHPYTSYSAFVMEATWWHWWCEYMNVRPVYFNRPHISSLVVDLVPVSNVGSNPNVMPWMKNVCYVPSDFAYSKRNMLEPYGDDLKPLQNSSLLRKKTEFKGLYSLLGSDKLVEWPVSGDKKIDDHLRYYVLLPFELGVLLYHEFDLDSDKINANNFRRYLVFDDDLHLQNSSQPEQQKEQLQMQESRQLNGSPQVIAAVDCLLTQLRAVPTILADLYIDRVPIFCCTRIGIAAVSHFDVAYLGGTLRAENARKKDVLADEDSFSWQHNVDLPTKVFICNYMKHLKVSVTINGSDDDSITQSSSTSPALLHCNDIRWWGLLSTEQSRHSQSPSTITLCYSATKHWKLLTCGESDYNRPFLELITQSPGHLYEALMIEFRNVKLTWPSSRMRSWYLGKKHFHMQPQEKLVGQSVDVLTDFHSWMSGQVVAVARESNSSDNCCANIVVLLSEPFLINGAGDLQRYEQVNVPFESGRIVPAGFMTKLCFPNTKSSVKADSRKLTIEPTETSLSTDSSNDKWFLRCQTVADLPPLIVSIELELNFAEFVKETNGFDIGSSLLEQYERFVERLRNLRLFRGTQVQKVNDEISGEKLEAGGVINEQQNVVNELVDSQPPNDNGKAIGNDDDGQEEADSQQDQVSYESYSESQTEESIGPAVPNSSILKKSFPSSNIGTLIKSMNSPAEFLETNFLQLDDVEEYYQNVKEGETNPTEAVHLIFEPSADISPAKSLLLSSILPNRNKSHQSFRLLYTINRTDDLLYNNDSRHIKLVATPTPEVEEEKDTPVNNIEKENSTAVSSTTASVLVQQSQGNYVPATNETMTNSTVDTNVSENATADSQNKTMLPAKIKGICSKYMHSLSSQVKILLRSKKSGKKKDSDRLSAMYYNNYNNRTSNSIYRSDGLDSNLEIINNNNNKGGQRSGYSKMEIALPTPEGPIICLNVGVVGLNNMGNTCFLSSALQCLIRTPLFTTYFLTNQYKADLNFINSIGKFGQLSVEFASILHRIFKAELIPTNEGVFLRKPPTETLNGRDKSQKFQKLPQHKRGSNYFQSMNTKITKYERMSLNKFLRVFQNLKPYFNGNSQQDAQEFLSELLDSFHEDLKKSISKKVVHSPPIAANSEKKLPEDNVEKSAVMESVNDSQQSTSIVPPADDDKVTSNNTTPLPTPEEPKTKKMQPMSMEEIHKRGSEQWEVYMQKNTSIISHVFTGQLCSKVVCKECNSTSVKFEVFTSLSLPLPKYFNSSNPANIAAKKSIDVVITVFRKLPRFSHICMLKKNHSSKYFTPKYLHEIQRLLRIPVRLVINLPLTTSIHDMTIKAVNSYNSILSQTTSKQSNTSVTNSSLSESVVNSTGTENITLASPLGLQIPDLLSHNTIVIDDNVEGTVTKRILDSKESIQSLMNEESGTLRIILQENSKNMSFLTSLAGTELTYKLQTFSKSPRNFKPLDPLEYYYAYTDELEYESQHHNKVDWKPNESRLFTDLDYKFDLNYLTAQLTTQNISSHHTVSKAKKSKKSNEEVSRSPSISKSSDDLEHSKSNGSSSTSMFGESFPTKLVDFAVGDRVDAADRKSMWYSGTVVDKYKISLSDVRKYSLKKYIRRPTPSSGRKETKGNRDYSKPLFITSGVSIRIHFDTFSYFWDEWFDQQDLDDGFIAPIYTKTQRKVKMMTFYIIQRILAPVIPDEEDESDEEEEEDEEQIASKSFYPHLKTSNQSITNSVSAATSVTESITSGNSNSKNSKDLHLASSVSLNSKKASISPKIVSSVTFTEARRFESDTSIKTGSVSGSNKNEDKLEYRIEVLETPLVIQCESYRSTQHLYNHITEQVMRYYSADELDEVFNGDWVSNARPFTLRMISNGNFETQPIDMQTYLSPGVDRFYGHKNWEGMEFPINFASYFPPDSYSESLPDLTGEDFSGPLSSIFHSKLILTVDWHLNKKQSSYEEIWRRRDPRFYCDFSYERYLARQAEQQNKLDNSKHSTESASPKLPTLASTAAADNRVGIDLEYVLKKFVDSEELEEYSCDNCKATVPATITTTIFRLPDVLILHLKRLVINSTGGGKIRTLVKFPIDHLNVAPFLTDETSRNSSYSLYGVVNHLGGMYGGHYTSFAKCESIIVSSSINNSTTSSSKDEVNIAKMGSALLSAESLKSFAAADLKWANKVPDISEYLTLSKAETLHSAGCYRWLKFDDEFVIEVPVPSLPQSLVTDGAYLLFYERKKFAIQNLLNYT